MGNVESAMKLLAISLAFLVSSTHAWFGDGNYPGTTVEPGATETPMGPPDYVIEPMGPTDDYEDAFRSLKSPPKYSIQELLTLQSQKYPLLGRFLGASFPDLVFGQNLKLGVKVKENPFGQKGTEMPGYRGYNYYQRPIFGPNRHGYRYGEYLWKGDLYPSKPYSHGPPKYSGYRQWTKAKDSKENNPISAQSEESKESNPKWDKPKW